MDAKCISFHPTVLLMCTSVTDRQMDRPRWQMYEGRSNSFASRHVRLKNFSISIHQKMHISPKLMLA